jgi:NTE family protein
MRETVLHGEVNGLLAFLAKAPVEKLIARARVTHFTRGMVVCTGDQLTECAYLLLDGACEHRTNPADPGSEPLRIIAQSECFGLLPERKPVHEDSVVVATMDSVVLGIRRADLTDLATGANEPGTVGLAPQSDNRGTSFFFKAPDGKLSVLVFLSNEVPGRMITNHLARRLRTETGESVVQVQFVAETGGGSRASSADLAVDEGAARLDIPPHDDSDVPVASVIVGSSAPSDAAIGALLQRLCRRFQHVLVEVTADHLSVERLTACMVQAGKAAFFLQPTERDLYRLDLLLHELRPRVNGHLPGQLKPVLCLAPDERVEGFDARFGPTGLGAVEYLHHCPRGQDMPDVPTGRFARDLHRLARSLGDRLIGLALSSGGAKGFAHIGVIQVLEENGIDVDVVAGASMGAYVGALYAYGCDGGKLEQLAHEMEARWALWSLIDPVFPPRQGFIRGDAVERRLRRTIGDAQFGDLVRPLRIVATNLNTLGRVVFSSGLVVPAVHASTAVPGICLPVRLDDEVYIDGGIVDPLPTDVLHELGIRRIIAVNTVGTVEQIRRRLRARHERHLEAERRLRKRQGEFTQLAKHLNYFAPGNILEIIMTSIHGAQLRVAEASGQLASVVLQPETAAADRWLDLRHPGHHIAAGRVAALAQLEEIKRIIQSKGAPHEHEPATSSLATAA